MCACVRADVSAGVRKCEASGTLVLAIDLGNGNTYQFNIPLKGGSICD